MSNHPAGDNAGYTARSEYLAEDVAQNYVRNRFSGALGKYRYRREQRAVNKLLGQLPADQISAVLDCPTGIGRWIPNLAAVSPQRIVGVDVSPTMLKRAREVRIAGVSLEFQEGVAESLPFEAGEFDLVFCHALLKHLPEAAQLEVLRELARVSGKYVLVAASVRRGPAGIIRQFRQAKGAVAVKQDWFEKAAASNGLSVISSRKATTPLGVEYSYLLRKA